MPQTPFDLASWPVATITVGIYNELDLTQPPASANNVAALVEQAIAAGPENTGPKLIKQPYFDEVDGFVLGQVASRTEYQFIILPDDDARPYFLQNEIYFGLRIVSHTWQASRTMGMPPSNEVIIAATKEFAQRIRTAYEAVVAQGGFAEE